MLLGLAGWLVLRLITGPVIDADLMSLLPMGEVDPAVSAATRKVEGRFERSLVVVIESPSFEVAKKAAHHVFDELQASGQFAVLRLSYERDMMWDVGAFYLPLRFQILDHATRQALLAGDAAAVEQGILERYFGLKGSFNSATVLQDPLLLLPSYLEERAGEAAARLQPEEGYLTLRSGDKVYLVLTGELSETPFSLALQELLVPVLKGIREELTVDFEGSQLLTAGVLPHAIAGTDQAYAEMSSVGLGSLLGVIALLFLVFRSWLPFSLSLISIVAGCLGGFAASIWLFGEVHLLTLVFGSSLVGISVDYSLHFFCERFRDHRSAWSPDGALAFIFPGITLGLVTSVIGFSGLFFTPFPGMQQMAVFSSAGLFVAYGCVVAWYPLCTRRLAPPRSEKPLDWAQAYVALWSRPWRWPLRLGLLGLLVTVALGGTRLVVEDDVRLLQAPDPKVVAEVNRTRELIGRNLASQFFLVEGVSEGALLVRQEHLGERLRELRASGLLEGHLAIADFLPSPTRQEENRALLAPLILEEGGVLARLAETIGLPEEARAAYAVAFEEAQQAPPATLSQWLAHPVSLPYRHLWLGRSGEGLFSVVGLRGIFDLEALRQVAAEKEGVHFIDPAGDVSALFGEYRREAGWLIFISYLLVAMVLLFRYGPFGGAVVMAPPLLAAFFALGVLGLLGEPINLFNIVALLLVLGIGVDYSLFFRETGVGHPATFLAIAMSCLTTLLAFGLLAFSRTTAIHAFGLTVLIGIPVALLLSPLAGIERRRPK